MCLCACIHTHTAEQNRCIYSIFTVCVYSIYCSITMDRIFVLISFIHQQLSFQFICSYTYIYIKLESKSVCNFCIGFLFHNSDLKDKPQDVMECPLYSCQYIWQLKQCAQCALSWHSFWTQFKFSFLNFFIITKMTSSLFSLSVSTSLYSFSYLFHDISMQNNGIPGKKWKYLLMHVFLQSPSFV